MDLVREQQHPFWRRNWKYALVLLVPIAVYLGFSDVGSADFVVDQSRVSIAEVQKGEFRVDVRGVGVVIPKHNQVLIAKVEGNVERIEREAGARVNKGETITRIANPKLNEQLLEMQWELAALKKENHAGAVALRAELYNLTTEAKNAKSSYQLALKKVEAEQKLIEKGIVSILTFEQTKLAAEQQKDKITSTIQRVKLMEERLAAMEDAHEAREQKMNNSLNLIKQQVADLEVKAPIDGVVQQISVKLGQSLTKGADIGQIAPHDNLVAILDIQDYQARDVRLGQAVNIDARGNQLVGEVARIEPTVNNGVVKVEVELHGKLPADLRANQSIEGVISIEERANALYVSRPPLAKGNDLTSVFLLDGDTAVRTPVEFGLVSSRHIEVLSGLKLGNRIIVSDTAAWADHDRVYIK